MESQSNKDLVVLSVVGRNRVGVLAEVTSKIAELGGNIQDIGQKMVGNYFSTLMVIELENHQQFSPFKKGMETLGGESDYKVMIQHEKVFQYMHRIDIP